MLWLKKDYFEQRFPDFGGVGILTSCSTSYHKRSSYFDIVGQFESLKVKKALFQSSFVFFFDERERTSHYEIISGTCTGIISK